MRYGRPDKRPPIAFWPVSISKSVTSVKTLNSQLVSIAIDPIDHLAIFLVDHAALYFESGRQLASRNCQFIAEQRDFFYFFELSQILCARGDLTLKQIHDPWMVEELIS